MSSSQASTIAKQGLSYLFTATRASVEAISTGLTTVRKKYSDHQAREQLELLKKSGKSGQEILFLVFQRFYYLSLAGYKNELSAAARRCATRLLDPESSILPLEGVLSLGKNLLGVSQRYGDAGKTSTLQNLQDFLNSGRMGKDHYDRDNLSNDFYYAILYLFEIHGGMNFDFQETVKNAALKLLNSTSSSSTGSSGYVSPVFNPSLSLPDYATVPSAPSSSTPSASSFSYLSSSSSNLATDDPQTRASKVVYVLASSINKLAEEADLKRLKKLKEAEEIIQKQDQSRVRF